MTEQHLEDPLLAALRAARPAGDEELSPDSLEASALLARIVGGDGGVQVNADLRKTGAQGIVQ